MPGATIRQSTSEAREHILEIAESLFAEHGFDGLSTRELATRVGLNISTISYHCGSKHDLYMEVMTRTFTRQRSVARRAVDRVLTHPPVTPEGVVSAIREFVDDLVETTAANPSAARLFLHRALEPGGSDPLLDSEVGIPVHRRLRTLLRRGHRVGLIPVEADVDLLTTGGVWFLYGFVASRTRNATDKLTLEERIAAKRHLILYYCRMLQLPVPYLAGADITPE